MPSLQPEEEDKMDASISAVPRQPWSKGKLVGQTAPLKVKDIWAIRVRLQIQMRTRDLALFDLGIDSKLRGYDLVKLRVRDVCHGDRIAWRAIVLQQKTERPAQFEITPSTREADEAWITSAALRADDYLFPSRRHAYRASVRGSTLALWMVGLKRSDLILRRTERTRSDVPSLRLSIGEPGMSTISSAHRRRRSGSIPTHKR
jgi:integrase